MVRGRVMGEGVKGGKRKGRVEGEEGRKAEFPATAHLTLLC